MRPVNLLPVDLRPRIPGEGDPRIAWGVLGGLAVVLLMIVVSISYSNKAKTLNDEAAATRAEAEQLQASVAMIPTKADDVSDLVHTRTLLVGGLSAVRFPWNRAMKDLSRSLPDDVTIDSINGLSAAATGAEAAEGGVPTMSPQMTLTGCTSGWVGYARLMNWLRQMPGVNEVKSNSSAVSPVTAEQQTDEDGKPSAESKRIENCGPAPLNFSLIVNYHPKTADLVGLPKPAETAPAADAGADPAAGDPAAAAEPAAGG